jgi:RPA family protein
MDYQTPAEVLATEVKGVNNTFKNGDEEKSPRLAELPSGEAVGRILLAGAFTELRDVGTDQEYLQARLVTADGEAIQVYAGKFGPTGAMHSVEPPAYVGVVGKIRTYETDDGSTNAVVDAEEFVEIDESIRNDISAEAAEATLDRLPDESDEETAAIRESALAAARDVAGIEEPGEAEAESDESEESDGGDEGSEESEGDLEADTIEMLGMIQPQQADILASEFSSMAELLEALEAGEVGDIDNIGPATVESLEENRGRMEAA